MSQGESNEAAAERVAAVINPAAMAELLVGWCLEVEPHQKVVIRSTAMAAPLMLELQRAVLARDAWPTLHVELPGQAKNFYESARDAQLDDFDDVAMAEAKELTAVLGIQAPHDARELAGVDPARIARAARARRPLRERTMKKRWCSTLWPTPAGAELAGMELEEFAAFVRGATFLERPDPPAAWGELGAFQAELVERLEGVRELRIEAEGTDLKLSVKGRTWVNSDGRRNMPSGEIFSGPVENIVEARAERGDEYLQQALRTDEGARKLGEVGIGTNFGITRPVGSILFDEKIGGTVHLALGRSYPETGGRNESALHWDLICDLRKGGKLTADGAPLLVDGQFVAPA